MLALEVLFMLITLGNAFEMTRVAVLAPRGTENPGLDTVGYYGLLSEGTITLCTSR